MLLSEYIQIACAVIGLSGIAYARMGFVRRQQATPSISTYSDSERLIHRASWAVLAFALILVFFPF